MNTSQVQEDLLSLYLRLNGYFSSGFIAHSEQFGKNRTEIDLLAVRFPYSAEPERKVPVDPILLVPEKKVDLLICEVKSKGQPLHFNKAFLQSADTIMTVLRRAGLFREEQLEPLAMTIQKRFAPHTSVLTSMPVVSISRSTSVRALICCPERYQRRDNQSWFLSGQDIFRYLSACFTPDAPRDTCSIRYDFSLWGHYEGTVRYFKGRPSDDPGSMCELYKWLSSK